MKAKLEVSNRCPKCGALVVAITDVSDDGSYFTDDMKCTGCGNSCFLCIAKCDEESDMGYMIVTWDFK